MGFTVLHLILTVFVRGEDPPQDLGISDALEIPIRMVRKILQDPTRHCRQIFVGILPIRDAMLPEVSLLVYNKLNFLNFPYMYRGGRFGTEIA